MDKMVQAITKFSLVFKWCSHSKTRQKCLVFKWSAKLNHFIHKIFLLYKIELNGSGISMPGFQTFTVLVDMFKFHPNPSLIVMAKNYQSFKWDIFFSYSVHCGTQDHQLFFGGRPVGHLKVDVVNKTTARNCKSKQDHFQGPTKEA